MPCPLQAALETRGLYLQPVWRTNASRLVSMSTDGCRLYVNEAISCAPEPVLHAVARFAEASLARRRDGDAVRTIQEWVQGPGRARFRAVAAEARRARRTRGTSRSFRVRTCQGSAAQAALLRTLYLRLNAERFGGSLPDWIPLVWSYRMTRTLGNCRVRSEAGHRLVVDIGLNASLLLKGNESELRDTLIHEMAHVAAWTFEGRRGHCARWKAIARTAGCDPRARCRTSPRARGRATRRIERCPHPASVLAADAPDHRRRELGGRRGSGGRAPGQQRKPSALPAFSRMMVEDFAEGVHAGQTT